jgi:hypothetical protein
MRASPLGRYVGSTSSCVIPLPEITAPSGFAAFFGIDLELIPHDQRRLAPPIDAAEPVPVIERFAQFPLGDRRMLADLRGPSAARTKRTFARNDHPIFAELLAQFSPPIFASGSCHLFLSREMP